jgi:hypothetical protein
VLDYHGSCGAEGELSWIAELSTTELCARRSVGSQSVFHSGHLLYLSELKKLGPSARGWLYIQLSNFPSHYLVLVIADDEFRYALISVEVLSETMYANLIMKDIGWLDIRRIHGENVVVPTQPEQPEARTGQKRKRDIGDEGKEKGRPR